MRERFLREARAAAALDHPNICAIYDLGEVGESELFLVMPFYRGETLRARLEREPLSFDEARRITIQVARALDHAHRAMILHRDIKPANVMLTAENEVKVLDFGLAKIIGEIALTHTGRALGTPAYMSPEQATGSVVDQRSDLWSLGATLYEMLAGERAFPGAHPQVVIFSIVTRDPTPLHSVRHGIPEDLLRVVERCLAKDPAERYASAADLLADLDEDPTLPSSRVVALPGSGSKTPGPASRVGVGSQTGSVAGRLGENSRSRGWSRLGTSAVTEPVAAAPSPRGKSWIWPTLLVVLAAMAGGGIWYFRSEAELHRQHAARMVDFLVLDVAPELDVNGQVELLGKATNEAEQFLQPNASQLDGESLRRQTQILRLSGSLQLRQGNSTAALERFTSACDLLAKPAIADTVARRELAFCRNFRAEALMRVGEMDAALSESQAVLNLLGEAIERDSQDPEGRLAAAESHGRIGRLLTRRGSFEDALTALRRAVKVAESTRGPAHAQSRLMEVAAHCQMQVGNIFALQGALEPAEQAYRQALEKAQLAHQTFPQQPRLRERVANTEMLLANVALRRRKFDQAMQGYQRALTEWETLRQLDPSNTRWQIEIAKAYFAMGSPNSGRPSEQAMSWLLLSRQVLESLLANDPKNSDAKSLLITTLHGIGMTLTQAQRPVEALAPLQNALDLAGKARQADPKNYLHALSEAEGAVLLGECHRHLKDENQARELWLSALEMIEKNPELRSSPLAAVPSAWALLGLGRVDEARPFVKTLHQRAVLGYPLLDELIRRNGLAGSEADAAPFQGDAN